MNTFVCVTCKRELPLNPKLNSKQRKAVVVCTQCVRDSMTPEELQQLLNPKS